MSTVIRQTEGLKRKANPEALEFPRAAAAEEALIGMLILHPDMIPKVRDKLPTAMMLTSFNRRVYAQLLDRSEKGLMVELSFLSADHDEEEMGYLAQAVQAASGKDVSMQELESYIRVLADERARGRDRNIAELSGEEIREILQAMKEAQQGGNTK